MQRVWYVGKGGTRSPKSVAALQSLLLRQRGILTAQAAHFFAPTYETVIHDPLLLSDMKLAVDRIFHAIKHQERIIVHGDYDADGISSTAILITVITQLGGIVAPHLPSRFDDGYGLSQKTLEHLAPEMDLLIAVDCGITSVAEVAFLKKKKVDAIIIDHHTVPAELPAALAIVHPRHPKQPYPFPWLCGAGLAWKTAQALLRDPRSPFHADPDHEKWLLDLALLGTIADVVPLLDENRAIVRFGLEVLRRSKRPGIRALLASTRLSPAALTVEDIAFRIIPRLNAAGRMADPGPALELLLAANEQRAEELIEVLNQYNLQRQTVTKRIMREAELQVELDAPFVFAVHPSWPSGVVGLAASRLAEKFHRPAIVVGGAGQKLVGSARSPVGMSVLALLQQGESFLSKLGGHTQAAGFTVADGGLDNFKAALQQAGGVALAPPTSVVSADTLLESSFASQPTIDALRHFAPYGEGNRQPTFILSQLTLADVRPVGSEQKHAKMIFRHEEEVIEGIGFSLYAAAADDSVKHQLVDVVCHIEENEFRGQRRLQLNVKDIAPTQTIPIHENDPSHTTH